MSITVNWLGDSNAELQKFEIYRATAKADVYKPESLLTTINDPTTRSYKDTTAGIDKIYYYGVRTFSQVGPIDSSPEIGRSVVAICGPGSSKISTGSFTDGVFERLPVTESGALQSIIRRQLEQHILSVTGTLTVRTDTIANPGFQPTIAKIAYNGNILFIDEDPRFTISAPAVQVAGLVKTKFIDTVQSVDTELYSYNIRLMTEEEFIRYQLCFGGIGDELRFITQSTTRPIDGQWIINRGGQYSFAIMDGSGGYYWTLTPSSGAKLITPLVLMPK